MNYNLHTCVLHWKLTLLTILATEENVDINGGGGAALTVLGIFFNPVIQHWIRESVVSSLKT